MFEQLLAQTPKGTNWTIDKLAAEPQALKELSAALAEQGIDESRIGKRLGGTTALVVAYGHNSVLRVVDAKEEPPTHEAVDWKRWQPARDFGTLKGFNVEIHHKALPMDRAINEGRLTRETALELTKGLVGEYAREGKFLWDLKPDNLSIGFTPEGKPVAFVLDPGAVVPMAEKNAPIKGLDNHTNLAKFAIELDEAAKAAGKPDPAILADPDAYLAALKNNVVPPAMDRQELQQRNRAIEQNIADLPASPPEMLTPVPPKQERSHTLRTAAAWAGGALLAAGGGMALFQAAAAVTAGATLAVSGGALAMLAGGAVLLGGSAIARYRDKEPAHTAAAPERVKSPPQQGRGHEVPSPALEHEGNVRADGRSWTSVIAAQKQQLAR